MGIELGGNSPWLDNWSFQRQLWRSSNRTSGNELKLIPSGRFLTVQWRDPHTDTIVLAANEFEFESPIRVVEADRGVVEVALSGSRWNQLRQDRTYQCEIIAYGYLYDSFDFAPTLPNSGRELLNGVEVYGSPRKVLGLIGRIPGAEVEISVDLSSGWAKNPQGYWVRSIPKDRQVYGLWINDLHARQVPYEMLGTGCDRQWSRIEGDAEDTLYYKGPEILTGSFVETAFSWQVLLNLKEATAEIDRYTGQFFNKQRIYRETHRGTYRQAQMSARIRPVIVDQFFRLDCYSHSRNLVRRYTETDIQVNQSLHVEGSTAIITLTQNFWDWADWSNDVAGVGLFRGSVYLTPGENNLELTYTAGYERTPTDISEAAASLAAAKQAVFWSQAITQGMAGISIGCVNMNFGDMFGKWLPIWEQNASSVLGAYQFIEIEAF